MMCEGQEPKEWTPGEGLQFVMLLESRIRNLDTKMGSAMKRHTSLQPCLVSFRLTNALAWD